MTKRNKIYFISLALLLVTGLGLTGTAIAFKGNGMETNSLALRPADISPISMGASENTKIEAVRMGGPRGFRGGGYGGGIYHRVTLTRIATFLGMTVEELTTQLTGGKTLAQIATEKGKTAKDLVAVILAPNREHLQVNVKYGYVSQVEADALYNLRAVRTEARISQPLPTRSSSSGSRTLQGFRIGIPRIFGGETSAISAVGQY